MNKAILPPIKFLLLCRENDLLAILKHFRKSHCFKLTLLPEININSFAYPVNLTRNVQGITLPARREAPVSSVLCFRLFRGQGKSGLSAILRGHEEYLEMRKTFRNLEAGPNRNVV
jgi:hypothetical protein